LSEKEQIDRLKGVALQSMPTYAKWADYEARVSAVNAVAAFGVTAIPALIEIGEKASVGEVKKRALDWIALLKSPNKT